MNNEQEVNAVIRSICQDDKFDDRTLSGLPLAMAYVPMQKWQKLYEPDVAFERGTIFSELDLPFLGRRAIER